MTTNGTTAEEHPPGKNCLLIVGNLKTGKTTLFEQLTGGRFFRRKLDGVGSVTVGRLSAGPFREVVDLPGIQSIEERSEHANQLAWLLENDMAGGLLVVCDARRLARGLALVLELSVFDLPMVVALNMSDELGPRGLRLDVQKLAKTLGIPVVATVAREGTGVGSVVRSLAKAKRPRLRARIPERILKVLEQYEVDAGKLHLTEGRLWLALQVPWLVPHLVDSVDDLAGRKRLELALAALEQDRQAMSVQFVTDVLDKARELADSVTEASQAIPSGWFERLTRLTRRPVTAVPIAIVVLALVYLFVGKLGAEVLVDLLEGELFGGLLIPWLAGLIDRLGVPLIKDLLVGQFGLISVGITLSFGIVLPVLATFFVAFSILEDSGYLPRLSLLADRGLRRLGLTGKAVLPLVMGFSCITMAVLTTRMLETKKQRIIATALLVLTVPCAPLLSVMLVALGRLKWTATAVVAVVLVVQLLLVGVLANMLLPGRRPELVMELPRLHAPQLRNVLVRSGHSLVWFMKEALPYFLLGTMGLFLLDKAGGLDWLRHVFEPVSVRLLGLPAESADAFLMTIVRREAGAALLVNQLDLGLYQGPQVVVALVVMTVMLPCINTLLVMIKERGVIVSTILLVLSISVAVAEGTLLNWLLGLSGASF